MLAYDGTAYYGYQVQPDVPTVQGEVEAALAAILGTKTTVWAAGRTDTGVHATGQVIAFDAPTWKHDAPTLLRALNANLPDDIALQDIQPRADFHPRFDALSRTYRYRVTVAEVRQPLLIKRAWQVQQALDDDALAATAALLVGEHDFAAFGNPPQGTNTVRHLFSSQWEQTAFNDYIYEVRGTAFLQHMVRRLVGTMVAAGRGYISVDDFERIFVSRDLSQAKWLAPPQGLTLIAVEYPSAADVTDKKPRTAGTAS